MGTITIPPPPSFKLVLCLLAPALLLPGCSSVPGETMAPRGVQREVNDRVLGLARGANPQCRQPRVASTEVVDVHSDGRSSSELWVVESCGRRISYIVGYPVKKGPGFSVSEEPR